MTIRKKFKAGFDLVVDIGAAMAERDAKIKEVAADLNVKARGDLDLDTLHKVAAVLVDHKMLKEDPDE